MMTDMTPHMERYTEMESGYTSHEEEAEAPGLLVNRLLGLLREQSTSVARRLNDEIGQTLSAVHMALTGSKPLSSAAQHRCAAEVRSAISGIREVATGLHPTMLEDVGLTGTLGWYCERFNRSTGAACTLVVQGDVEDPHAQAALELFRVVQTAMTMALSIGLASQILITVSRSSSGLCITISDDSVQPPLEVQAGRAALAEMRARLQRLNGTIAMFGTSTAGTIFRVEVPGISGKAQ